MKCHMALCRKRCGRSLYVRGVKGEWPTCDAHGNVTIRALMELHKGHGIYSKGRNER
jgi:hypothetical protein